MTASLQTNDALGIVLRAVNDPACDPSKLREILAVRREWMEDEARSAFNAAVVQFQQRAKIVAKGDTANGRAYARMDRIWRDIRPLLDDCGLAVTWESVKTSGDTCVLDGHLRHSRGHAQPLHHEMPMPDKLNGQNAAQRAGSGETYCKRYALMAALGIQTGEDDDGGGYQTARPASKARIAEVRDMLASCNGDESKACAAIGVRSLDDASADQIERVYSAVAKRIKGAP